ncbi:unnamed protein product [Adineta ricciae]|uniref:Uncharacterized protein n=1 Tax=Adineta ricciae TaxID=249248 RepID=A0A815M7P0_ADIRI|nr:unnamed protein product [Adineta ricciae]CAF1418719.1 unnamed protein product [Adineta ricciae]
MSLIQQSRDAFMQGIGLLAASLNLIGVNASNNQFNYRKIEQYRCSPYLHDEMIIRRFYVYETLIRHNFVVFQTDSGQTFKVHLIADIVPNDYSPVYIEIDRTYWKPDRRHVRTSNTRAGDLKLFVLHEIQKFGNYTVGLNDCRHFARAVAAFLSGQPSCTTTAATLSAFPFGPGYYYGFPTTTLTTLNSMPLQYPMGALWVN